MNEALNTLALFRAAAAEDLRGLAFLHAGELGPETLAGLKEADFPNHQGIHLASPTGREAVKAMAATVSGLPAATDAQALDQLAADFAAVYLTHDTGASPCESVWLDDDHIVCQEPMFQVRAWYERHGLAAQDWRRMADDHLVLQLEFIARLLEKDEQENAARFMDEHLLRWLGRFAERLAARNVLFYAPLAFYTWAYCEELRELLARLLGQPRPSREEIEARLNTAKATPQEVPLQYLPGSAPSW